MVLDCALVEQNTVTAVPHGSEDAEGTNISTLLCTTQYRSPSDHHWIVHQLVKPALWVCAEVLALSF